ncbi:MAG: sodium:proton antiporter, partial [Tissierellia bacterium]|nr:sodium:proton antiporter [Tissierellia bacterium]
MLLTNSVVVSVIVLCALCMLKLNVLLSLIIAAIVGGAFSGMPLFTLEEGAFGVSLLTKLPFLATEGEAIIPTFIGGMGSMAETALSYILIGFFAYAIGKSGLVTILAQKISKGVSNKRVMFVFIIAFVACFSQNLLPVHIAFIPILIPPLLGLMNRLKIDRRAVACALTFGLKAPYVTIPAGFGLIFHRLIATNMTENGMAVTVSDTGRVMWIGGLSMLIGLIFCVLVLYRKPREYQDIVIEGMPSLEENVEMTGRAWGALISALIMLIV